MNDQQQAETERLQVTIEKLENCIHAGADVSDIEFLAKELGVYPWMQRGLNNLRTNERKSHEPFKSY